MVLQPGPQPGWLYVEMLRPSSHCSTPGSVIPSPQNGPSAPQPGLHPPYLPSLTPSSQISAPLTMPSPQRGVHTVVLRANDPSVSLYDDPQMRRSAWNTAIS